MGKRSRLKIKINCLQCGKELSINPSDVTKGKKHCSSICYHKSHANLPLERIWDRVDKSKGEDSCWPYTGSKFESGYGMFIITTIGSVKTISAHRMAYILAKGEIPEGMKILHSCDNPPCCNPKHLRVGTQADNVADMMNKKRNVAHKCEKHWNSKLTQQQVEEIRANYKGEINETEVIANRYNVKKAAIFKIITGRTWK